MLTSSNKDGFSSQVWNVLVGVEVEITHDANMMQLVTR